MTSFDLARLPAVMASGALIRAALVRQRSPLQDDAQPSLPRATRAQPDRRRIRTRPAADCRVLTRPCRFQPGQGRVAGSAEPWATFLARGDAAEMLAERCWIRSESQALLGTWRQ